MRSLAHETGSAHALNLSQSLARKRRLSANQAACLSDLAQGPISVGGVLVLLAGVTLLGVLMVWELDGRVRHLRQMVAPTSLALLLVFAALGAMAFVRVLIPSTVYTA